MSLKIISENKAKKRINLCNHLIFEKDKQFILKVAGFIACLLYTSIDIDEEGNLSATSLKNIPVENFSEISNQFKDQDYSMNLEGVTIDSNGTFYIVSDNTSGKAACDLPAKEKTILLELKRK